jgi:hypothetical protein
LTLETQNSPSEAMAGHLMVRSSAARCYEQAMRNEKVDIPSFKGWEWLLRSARQPNSRLRHSSRRESENGGLGTVCNYNTNQRLQARARPG